MAQLVVVVLGVSFFSFFLLTLIPGDPVTAIVGFSSPAQHREIAHDLNLDEPILQRYWSWLTGFVHGDLGHQYFGPTGTGKVSTVVGQHLPVSIELMAYTMVITLVIAIPLGVFAAYRAGSRFDKAANIGAFGAISLPDYALGLVLAYWVGVRLAWLPAQGYVHPSESLTENIKSLTLPAISLAVGQTAAYMRLLRSDMIATLQEDYILMAKAKGLPTRRVLWRHTLRPSSLTVLTVAGLNIGALIGGTVVIEVIFGIPGMGYELFQAIGQGQYVEVQSLVAIIAIGFVLVNFAIDILYTILDPGFEMLEQSRSGDANAEISAVLASTPETPDEAKYETPSTKRLGVGGYVAAAWLVFIVLYAFIVPLLFKTQLDASLANKGFLKDLAHPLGGDDIGQSLTIELAEATRNSLMVAFGAVGIGLAIGGSLGLLAGYMRGRLDGILTGVFNILLAIPQFILAVALVTVLASNQKDKFGADIPVSFERRFICLVVALGIVAIPLLGRITRANSLQWSQREFVMAARSQGATNFSVMRREVLPNVVPAMFSIALLSIAVAIVAEGALSILGAGVQGGASLGSVINGGKDGIRDNPHIVFEPVAIIFLTVLSLNYLGDVIRARFDVRESVL